jgi:signal-transduction protein with cAMP-binding, CBS, and nucleotidyltransferase domain
VVDAGTPLGTVVEQLSAIEAGGANAAVVVRAGRPVGIVTERDVTRRVAFRLGPDAPAEAAMSAPLIAVDEAEFLYQGIALMRRHGLRHLPVLDAGGGVKGLFDLHAALDLASAEMVEQIDRLSHEGSIEGMAHAKAAEVEVAAQLFEDGVSAPEVQALLSDVNRDLTRRAAQHCARETRAALGMPAPLAFEVIVMGSGGRRESYVRPDQDIGVVLADYPDDAHGDIDPWFIDFGVRLSDALDRIGFPYCKGGVMALNPLWRKTKSQWRAQIDLWIRKRNANFIRLADIFFDFAPVQSQAPMSAALRDYVTARLKGNHMFLSDMWGVDEDRKVAIGLFNRFITERKDAEHRGQLNLKFNGTLPLVETTRLLALREGIPATGTLERLAALAKMDILGGDEHDYLAGAFAHITGLLLRQQVRDFATGSTSNYVDPESLTERERDMLVDGLKAIEEFLDRVRYELKAELF